MIIPDWNVCVLDICLKNTSMNKHLTISQNMTVNWVSYRK